MLQPSDNFIAEQLLLVCSSVKFGVLNKDSVINYSVKNFLNDLPDKPQWADGSGLSRFDLFTPRDMIKLLCKIQEQMKNEKLLLSMMPIGGVAGTIRSAYKTDNGVPFVWAKTGSLANNHNQSGYLVTRKGHRLAYSFMNNNFVRPTSDIRNEMVRIMTYIHENY
jgi:D-alanyl-D-alanine carboxypeptidase/D-alanyl-D-alanine-endopeptidase (penicillin-binding protein 4)